MAAGKSPVWARESLRNEDVDKVSEAVRQAESKTHGEIVPLIVRVSTPLRGVLINSILFCVLLFSLLEIHFFAEYEPWSWAAALILGVIIGIGLAQLPTVQRFWLPDHDEMKAVHERAELEFFRQRVHTTQGHTGILIFISLLERRVVILADHGISGKLPADVWDQIIEELLKHIRRGDLGTGLTRAIESCGELLTAQFPRSGAPADELPNELVFKD